MKMTKTRDDLKRKWTIRIRWVDKHTHTQHVVKLGTYRLRVESLLMILSLQLCYILRKWPFLLLYTSCNMYVNNLMLKNEIEIRRCFHLRIDWYQSILKGSFINKSFHLCLSKKVFREWKLSRCLPKTHYMKLVLCQKLFAKCKIVQFDMKYVKGNDKKKYSQVILVRWWVHLLFHYQPTVMLRKIVTKQYNVRCYHENYHFRCSIPSRSHVIALT